MITAEQLRELATGIAVKLQWPEIMNLETAARYMDRTVVAIRHLIEDGKIRVTCIDGKKQIRRRDIDEAFEAGLV